MKIGLNTGLIPLFSGTYNTIWDVTEYSDDGEELDIQYEFKDLMQSIADTYKDHAEEIKEALGVPYINNIVFSGDYYSPREYNFSTDTLDFTLDVNEVLMLQTAKDLVEDTAFNKWLHDNFASYDGFISYTPDNATDLYSELISKNRYAQAVAALTTYLSGERDAMSDSNIEFTIFEEWACNEYNGLEYTATEPEA